MQRLKPGALLVGGRYRLERPLLAHDDVTIWEATDVHAGRSVRLSVFEHGSTVLGCGGIEDGAFAVVDAPARPRLELVAVSEEDAFFDEPPAPELFDDVATTRRARARGVVGALVACALLGLGGVYFLGPARPIPARAVTLTEARMPAPAIAAPPTTTAPIARLPTPTAAPSAAPRRAPRHHALPRHAPHRLPTPPPPPAPEPTSTATSDPLTL